MAENPDSSRARQFPVPETGDDLWLPEAEIAHPQAQSFLQLPAITEQDVDTGLDSASRTETTYPNSITLEELAKLPLTERVRLTLTMRAERIGASFLQAVGREQEAGNNFNFIPAGLALGIIAYFAAPAEPALWALSVSVLVAIGLILRLQSRGMLHLALIAFATVLTGMLVSKLQVERSVHPVPLSQMTTQISGVVLGRDLNRAGRARYLIRPDSIEGLASAELPPRIRVSGGKRGQKIAIGHRITGLARLSPYSGPAYPSGYDFAFNAWIEGIGLSGFFMGAPKDGGAASGLRVTEQVSATLQSVRMGIASQIRAGLPGEAGDIAAALITGDRSGLSDETNESLRRSGLAHILAISGLHMALVTLTVIWLVRIFLVSIPGVVEIYPVKKWAIIAGFLTASAYLLLSGMSIATQRAWLMISVMLMASLLDRRAITMRSVAIAAILILLVSPASLFQPGFQMSFAAVAALVAVYREWTLYRANLPDRYYQGGQAGILKLGLKKSGAYLGGLSVTSLVAGLATALFALWHFHRVAPLGLISNLFAMPIVSIFVMPLALLSMILMPFGYASLALGPLGVAIQAVVGVSDKVNSYGLNFDAGRQPLAVLVSAALFLLLACGLRTRLRLFAVIPLAVLILSIGRTSPLPDILIAEDGRAIAIRSSLLEEAPDDGLSLLYPGRNRFINDIWQRAFLPNSDFSPLPPSLQCDKDGCAFDLQTGEAPSRVALVYDPDRLEKACETADILLAPRLWWVRCRGVSQPQMILSRRDFEARGSHEIRISAVPSSKTKFTVETARNIPRSAFEIAEDQRRLDGQETSELLAPRPWNRRFDNISRRFD